MLLTTLLLSACGKDLVAPIPQEPVGDLRWEPLSGPYVGDVRFIGATSQGHVFIVDKTGLYRSSDSGDTWVLLPSHKSSAFAISHDRLYLGKDFALFTSSDLGNTWSRTSFNTSLVRAIAVDDDGRIYVAPAYDFTEPPAEYPSPVLHRSTDGGGTWQAISLNWPADQGGVGPLEITGDGHVIVGIDSTLLASYDHGDSWQPIGRFPDYITNLAVGAAGELYVLMRYPGAVYRSMDSGDSWDLLARDLGRIEVAFAAPDGDLWVGTEDTLFRGQDSGLSWQTVDTGFSGVRTLFVNQYGAVFVGLRRDGILRSLDGLSFEQMGLRKETVIAIATDTEGTIYLGQHISRDLGESWTRADVEAVDGIAVNSHGHVFLATSRGSSVSVDGGLTWEVRGRYGGAQLGDIVVDTQDRLYSVAHHDGVYRTTDDGRSWDQVLPIDDWIRALHVTADDQLLVGSSAGAYVSGDGGQTWMAAGPEDAPQFRSFADLPGGDLLAGANGHGVYHSTDGGESWLPLWNSEETVRAILPYEGVILAGANPGMFVSVDGGITWTAAGLQQYGIRSLAIGPDGAVLAGTHSNGIFRGTF